MVGCQAVIGDFADEGSDDGQFLCDLSSLWEVVAEDIPIAGFKDAERSSVFQGCLWFRVEGFMLGEAPTEVQLDDAFDPLGQLSFCLLSRISIGLSLIG